MSTVLVVTPILVTQWPAIVAAVTAAMSAAGFTAIQEAESQARSQSQSQTNREEIEVEDSEILDAATGTGEQIVVQRDGIRATFSRDARGALRICMEGRGKSKSELRAIGEDLLGRVTQQFAYHRIVTELRERNMTIVDEQVTEHESVKIRVRNW
jgi:hypothetical protein